MVATNTSTEDESHSLQSQDEDNSSHLLVCSKCHSSDIDRMYIEGHDVLHCICKQCGIEWIE